jgi:hypothetical protein
MRGEDEHRWTEEDDIVALFLYKFGDSDLPDTQDKIGGFLGMGPGSLLMRIANFRSIDGQAGLKYPARQSRLIYERYNHLPQGRLHALILGVLDNVTKGSS